MRLGRILFCIAVCCGAMTVATVSDSLGGEPVQEARPKVEFSAGMWFSTGATTWAHNASSAGWGNPTSKLTYKDVGTKVIDLTGRFWFSPGIFGRINGGFGDIGGGRMTDDDYLRGQRLISQTTSNVSGNDMYYINADLGGRVNEFANRRGYLDIFGGYQYWHTEYRAVGVNRVVCDSAVLSTCNNALPSPEQTVITNKSNWHSIRVGASTEYRLTRQLSLVGTAALIPLSIIDNKDVHHLRNDLKQNPSISMVGVGIGADADVGVKFMFTPQVGVNVGYRVWWNHAIDGRVTFHGTSSSSQYPLVQFDSLRHGLTASLDLTF
ncbi:MAG: hypothetical protein OEV08_11115 [Nitrospira sp.]|nr:hypothetical protein [Nitrospira sp.]